MIIHLHGCITVIVIKINNKTNHIYIEKKRIADDSTTQYFEIKMDNGSVRIRNKRFLIHASKEPDRHVQISPQSVEHVLVEGDPEEAHGNSMRQPVLSADEAQSRERPQTRSMNRQQAV